MSTSTSSEKDTISKHIWQLKSSFRPRDFERVIKTLTAHDEAARRDASYWKSKHDAMEEKQKFALLEKMAALDDLNKLKRERDFRAENDQQSLMLKEKYARLRQDFDKVKAEKAELERRISTLELEKEETEACKSRFEELNRDFDRVKAEKVGLERRVLEMGLEKEKAEREAEECKSRLEEPNRRTVRLEEGTAAVASAEPVAAGSMVVIEIADSDNEMPTGKRGLSKDDYEDVKPTKKRLTELLEKLPDMSDGSDSSDSDSSSSGSDIDSKIEIERLSRKVSGMKHGLLKLK